jgi:GH35 family endo-1,4-beta-xylanase
LEAGIKVFTDLKYEVSLTELDIRIKKNDYSAATLELQASQYAQTYQACLKNPRCVSVVRWDLDDSQTQDFNHEQSHRRAQAVLKGFSVPSLLYLISLYVCYLFHSIWPLYSSDPSDTLNLF